VAPLKQSVMMMLASSRNSASPWLKNRGSIETQRAADGLESPNGVSMVEKPWLH